MDCCLDEYKRVVLYEVLILFFSAWIYWVFYLTLTLSTLYLFLYFLLLIIVWTLSGLILYHLRYDLFHNRLIQLSIFVIIIVNLFLSFSGFASILYLINVILTIIDYCMWKYKTGNTQINKPIMTSSNVSITVDS